MKATAAALLVGLAIAGMSAPALGGNGYIEGFDADAAGFQNVDDNTGDVWPEELWQPTGGNPDGHIWCGGYEYGWNYTGPTDTSPLLGNRTGTVLVIDAKGNLHAGRQNALTVLLGRVDENDPNDPDDNVWHSWLGRTFYTGWSANAGMMGDEWLRAVMPFDTAYPDPGVRLPGAWDPVNPEDDDAWTPWTQPGDFINDNWQDDMNYVLADINTIIIYGAGAECYIDNIGFAEMGDANCDRVVGIADLVALADNYGADDPTTVGWTQGDFNFDGRVGIADLVALAENYGSNYAAAGGGTVPEPATLLLIVGGAVAGLLRRRR